MGLSLTGQRLDMWNIFRNIIYSFFLLLTCIFVSVGLATYQWIETTAEAMEKSGIKIPASLPGLTSVSCGLTTYCLDAAGEVSECSLPWPKYGDSPSDVPSRMWQVALGFITTGLLLQVLCFIYSLMACFGCFSDSVQKWSTKFATAGGFFMLIGLLCWGGSFGDFAVEECIEGQEKVNNECQDWKGVFPSTASATNDAVLGCRICNYKMSPFMPDENCKVGFGAILVSVGCVLAIISGCIGEGIISKEKAARDNGELPPKRHQFTTKAGGRGGK